MTRLVSLNVMDNQLSDLPLSIGYINKTVVAVNTN